jgi:hypothetical protein
MRGVGPDANAAPWTKKDSIPAFFVGEKNMLQSSPKVLVIADPEVKELSATILQQNKLPLSTSMTELTALTARCSVIVGGVFKPAKSLERY